MPLPSRMIGETPVSSVGFGCLGLSFLYGDVGTREEQFQILDRAADLGCTHWDTAEDYADSEELLGAWFKRTGRRSEIFLATKFGFTPDHSIRTDAAYVKESADISLKKLGVETIDLFYTHRLEKNVPVEITVGAMAELVKEGKVKYLGLSECSSNTLRRAHAVHPISAVQVEYSPFSLDIEDPNIGLLKTARELGVAIVCYSPLGRGMLSGKYKSIDDFAPDDFRRIVPRFSNEHLPKTLKLADRLKEIGDRHNATASQVALAWILAQGADLIPIPGTKKLEYLEENVSASRVSLSDSEVAEIRQAAQDAGCADVARYPPFLMEQLYVETAALKR